MAIDPSEDFGMDATQLMETCDHDECSCSFQWPNGYALLQIDMRLMTDDQKRDLVDGLKLLRRAGLDFDTGMGFGNYDVELDWSLSGALITVGGLRCMAKDCPNDDPDGQRSLRERSGISPAYWSVYGMEGETWSRPYCSETCRARGDEWETASPRPPKGYRGPVLTTGDVIENPRFAEVLIHDVAEALKREHD